MQTPTLGAKLQLASCCKHTGKCNHSCSGNSCSPQLTSTAPFGLLGLQRQHIAAPTHCSANTTNCRLLQPGVLAPKTRCAATSSTTWQLQRARATVQLLTIQQQQKQKHRQHITTSSAGHRPKCSATVLPLYLSQTSINNPGTQPSCLLPGDACLCAKPKMQQRLTCQHRQQWQHSCNAGTECTSPATDLKPDTSCNTAWPALTSRQQASYSKSRCLHTDAGSSAGNTTYGWAQHACLHSGAWCVGGLCPYLQCSVCGSLTATTR
jgi:hypothetical protein